MSPTYGSVRRMRFPVSPSPSSSRGRRGLAIMTEEERRKARIPKYADTPAPLVCHSRGSNFLPAPMGAAAPAGAGHPPGGGSSGALLLETGTTRLGYGHLRVKQRRALAEREAAHQQRRAAKARIAHVKSSGSTAGSLYIGRGLGLRKTSTLASPLTAGSPTQILERILKK